MYVILGWSDKRACDTQVVLTGEDMPMMFNNYEKASEYARENLYFNWQVIEVET